MNSETDMDLVCVCVVQCNLDIVKKLVSGQYFTIRTFFTIQMFVSKDDMGCRFTPN